MHATSPDRQLGTLHLASAGGAEKAAFYTGMLGMRQTGPNAFGYGPGEVEVSFSEASGVYEPSPQDLYWKIAISVPDLDLAYRQLSEKGIEVSKPRQFRDVGYLAHLSDPEGFQIELIQHVFEGVSKPPIRDADALGGGPCLNLVTLRAAEIDRVHQLCVQQLGMKLICVEPVQEYGFTLYFFALTDEVAPDPDPVAVINRPWTYQRPYTVLEVQHLHGADTVGRQSQGRPGYLGLTTSGLDDAEDLLGLLPL